jgi:hypothetical protein
VDIGIDPQPLWAPTLVIARPACQLRPLRFVGLCAVGSVCKGVERRKPRTASKPACQEITSALQGLPILGDRVTPHPRIDDSQR